jgi:ubiquinone/menaquinone biosynthesis C-methylase UbiE
MYDTILPLMRCTVCHQDLSVSSRPQVSPSGEIVEGVVTCSAGHKWPVEQAVLVFSREDAPSDPWSKSYAKYETYCRHQETWLPEAAGQVAPLLKSLVVSSTDTVLDLCSGSGGLLFNLLDHLDTEPEVISLDMSLAVQRHNRRYWLERYGDRRVSFVSADAADVPFREGVFSQIVSFAMGNMLDRMALGVAEAARTLKDDGAFTFTHMYVDEGSDGWRLLSAYMREQGLKEFGFLGIERELMALLERVGFCEYQVRVTAEVVGAPDRDIENGPLFPYPNERMTELLIRAAKR